MNVQLESGWCLERGTLWHPQYLTVAQGRGHWTSTHLEALRFARREDAERVASLFRDAERVVEHIWS